MKAARLKGKTIRKVHQSLFESTSGKEWTIDAIEFTDGTYLRFITIEGDGDYGTAGVYRARPTEGTDQ